jgi:RimJ/RimL family protein N-acetyltransferase
MMMSDTKGVSHLETFELWSPRLCLRRLCPQDAASLVGYRSLPEVARFQEWVTFGPDDAARLIAQQARVMPDTPGTWLQLALVLLESGEVIGDCGIHFLRDEPRHVELGITLAPDHQGRGLATEALSRVLAYVFDTLDKHRASAVTDAENHAAAGLFRRLMFRPEAHFVEHVWFKGGWGSEYLFAMLQREWQARAEPGAYGLH